MELLILLESCQQNCVTYTIAVFTVKTPDDGQSNCPKHVEISFQNKFEKLVHLVDFNIRNFLDLFTLLFLACFFLCSTLFLLAIYVLQVLQGHCE